MEEKKKNKTLIDHIQELNKEINNLKNELEIVKKNNIDLSRLLFNIKQLNAKNENNRNGIIYKEGDKIISVGFLSIDQKIHYNRAYRDSEILAKVEEDLYNEYPELKDRDTYLLLNGNKIKRFKSLKENNIKNGDIILVNYFDDDIS